LSFFVSGFVDSIDGLQYLAVARNIYYTHEPTAPPNEFTGVGVSKNTYIGSRIGKDGKSYSPTGLGFSLALLPAVAITDVVYRIYNLTPPIHFPLENDWLTFLTASFTNIFFAAGIGVTTYVYLREVGVKHRSALIISLLGLLTTNLFVASKHIYAHTMFIFFLFSSFLLLKIHTRNKRRILLLLSGASWGIAMMTYNLSFLLAIIPYFIYFVMLNGKNFGRITWIILGILPFFILNNWYANLTYHATATAAVFFGNALKTRAGVIFEGLYGQLLSPGRSFFIYSPILLIPFIFWFKIKKSILPETVIFFLTLGLYVAAFSLLWLPNPLGFQEPLWHGEYSWGPRYLMPAIPFGLIVTGYLYDKIKRIQKLIFLVPLILVGSYVELLGITMHYQIKFEGLEPSFIVNGVTFTAPIYTNLLPRYSPLLIMSKDLINLAKTFPKTLVHGPFNVRFIDGIDFPFNAGPERWRAIDKDGYILFDNNKKAPVTSLTFDLINHPVDKTQAISKIDFYINNKKVSDAQILKIGERKKITVTTDSGDLKEKDNLLTIKTEQADYKSYFDKKQIIAIMDMYVNNNLVNIESIDVPYISKLGPAIMKTNYQNWGNNSNPWISWIVHTQVVERTPFFWWLHPVYYWDIPSKPYIVLFVFNLVGLAYMARRLFIT
jgi:hypothetical protein